MTKILPLITAPDPILKMVSKPIIEFNIELKKLLDDMVTTMYYYEGVGLAGVQVGVLKRILVMDIDYEEDEDAKAFHGSGCSHIHVKNTNPRYFVNPEIIESSKEESSFNEGCLSFPEARSQVNRPKKVKVKYFDHQGKEMLEEMEGLMAVCIQHEIDHLNGITFVDRISKLKKDMIMRKIQKLKIK
jgi:peptide deformylase